MTRIQPLSIVSSCLSIYLSIYLSFVLVLHRWRPSWPVKPSKHWHLTESKHFPGKQGEWYEHRAVGKKAITITYLWSEKGTKAAQFKIVWTIQYASKDKNMQWFCLILTPYIYTTEKSAILSIIKLFLWTERGLFTFLSMILRIRTNFTLPSGESFITGTYIRWNTCSTIFAMWIADSWNNQVIVTLFFVYIFGFKNFIYFTFDEQYVNQSKKSLNFKNIRKTVRIFCTISNYKYTSCTLSIQNRKMCF